MFANFLSWNGGTWDALAPSPVLVPGTHMDNLLAPSLQHLKIEVESSPDELSVEADTSILIKIKLERRASTLQDRSLPGRSFAHLQRQYALSIAPPVKSLTEKLESCRGTLSVFAGVFIRN